MNIRWKDLASGAIALGATVTVSACAGVDDDGYAEADGEGSTTATEEVRPLNPDDPELGDPDKNRSVPEVSPDGDTTKACFQRADLKSFLNVGSGHWGDWAPCYDFCHTGSFAYNAKLKSEGNQGGSGDDTAANGLSLHCRNRTTGADTGWITSTTQQWGAWGTRARLDSSFTMANPWIGAITWIEVQQGSGDDTSLNKIGMFDKFGGTAQGGYYPSFAVSFTNNIGGSAVCPTGQAVCGLRTRVEATQVGDDTALNGVSFACCTF
jgi:hypothetical protein